MSELFFFTTLQVLGNYTGMTLGIAPGLYPPHPTPSSQRVCPMALSGEWEGNTGPQRGAKASVDNELLVFLETYLPGPFPGNSESEP